MFDVDQPVFYTKYVRYLPNSNYTRQAHYVMPYISYLSEYSEYTVDYSKNRTCRKQKDLKNEHTGKLLLKNNNKLLSQEFFIQWFLYTMFVFAYCF